ncbi:unnamed protein product [Rhizoctonia solani]|uniref:Glutamate pyruvate transaminase n=1 Tax=Rhizoctonia solani TaxID=456999 RepID=A0A8H3A363_9AGAM|nr:unnamed protein product [Rhizoctonia solani]
MAARSRLLARAPLIPTRHLSYTSITRSEISFTMPPLTSNNINPTWKDVQYAVRGPIAIKAEEYRDRLRKGDKSLPFDRVVNSNIGNPQQKGLDQKPITFTRQVAALLEYPELMEKGKEIFPADAIARGKELYDEIGSIGAYSHSQGVPFIRENVAKFIEARDGHPADPSQIFLTAGASAGVSLLISMLISSSKAGILIPIPQYPLYTATLAQQGGIPIPYYLDESKGWSTSPDSVSAAVSKALKEGIEPKALVVINPGNPTGSILDVPTMEALLKICEEYSLMLLADEVYQANTHDPNNYPWASFKKVLRDTKSPVPLVSFHSISKGVSGECGRRGGYFELANVPDDITALIYKMVSVGLCPPLSGQVGVDSLVRPPKEGDESYALWKEETDTIHAALAKRSLTMAERLNNLPGMSCAPAVGALYLFPALHLTKNAVKAAQEAGQTPDNFYSNALLDETGICAVSGTGFGQKDGEAHFRLTCLCDGVEEYVGKLERFHLGFMEKYKD